MAAVIRDNIVLVKIRADKVFFLTDSTGLFFLLKTHQLPLLLWTLDGKLSILSFHSLVKETFVFHQTITQAKKVM